jgi:hypothetical protein
MGAGVIALSPDFWGGWMVALDGIRRRQEDAQPAAPDHRGRGLAFAQAKALDLSGGSLGQLGQELDQRGYL